MRHLALIFVFALALVVPAASQDSDDGAGFLERQIQDALSDAGRDVRISGFRGALSSQASLDSLTIADETGIWLRLEGAELSWNRRALFSRRLEVETLRADALIIERPPIAGEPDSVVENLPPAEARPFTLPELPVTIQIGEFAIDRIELGAPVMGFGAAFSVDGNAFLEDGSGNARFNADRLDGPLGQIRIGGDFNGETRALNLEIRATEAPDGIAAQLIGLPGAPSVDLDLTATGTPENLSSKLVLATDGTRNLEGSVTTETLPEGAGLRFGADLTGDLRPLLLAEYRPFFGPQASLVASGSRDRAGAVRLEEFALKTAMADLSGNLLITPDGLPRRIEVNGRIADPAGDPVLLPQPGAPIRIDRADIEFSFDADEGDEWTASADLVGLEGDFGRLARGQLAGQGRIAGTPLAPERAEGSLRAELAGLELIDRALARAAGDQVTLGTNFAAKSDGTLVLRNLSLSGDGYEATSPETQVTLDEELKILTNLSAEVADFSRFADLAGLPLRGTGNASLAGEVRPLSGMFDVDLSAATSGLGIGNETLDPLLRSPTALTARARRDETGTDLAPLTIENDEVSLTATALLSTEKSNATLSTRLRNVAVILPELSGSATLSADLSREGADDWLVDADATGPEGATVRATGALAPDLSRVDLQLNGNLPLELGNPFISPRLATGQAGFNATLNGPPALSSLAGELNLRNGALTDPDGLAPLERIRLDAALRNGRAEIDAAAQLGNGGQLRLTGPVVLSGAFDAALEASLRNARLSEARLFDTTFDADLNLTGPLAGSALLGGEIVVATAELRIPEATGAAGTALEGLDHVGESASARQSRVRAGFVEEAAPTPARAWPLDLTIRAPGRIFLRGRGLDAELGGTVRVTGTTADVSPSGRFDLIRGRLDILGTRLDLTEGSANLQGAFDPYIRLTAETVKDDTELRVHIEGRASEPELRFTSNPDLPEEEIVSLLIFGRGLSAISPLQAVQLAAAIRTLSGKGGEGVVGRLRRAFGLDDLDITTDETGQTSARLGRYLSDNLYSDVTIGAGGSTELNLNLQISPNVTARGSTDSDGYTSLGIFYQRDY